MYDILAPIYEAILDRFQKGVPLISYYPSDSTHDVVSRSGSHFFTAAILVLSSLKPTSLESRLISALSRYIPVIPVTSSHRISRLRNPGYPQPLTPFQLKTILSHSPQAIYRIRQEAVHRFLLWYYSHSVDSQQHSEQRFPPCFHPHPSITLDPLHLPSILLLSFSLCKSFVSCIHVPPRIFAITVIGAFCAGVGVGCYWARS